MLIKAEEARRQKDTYMSNIIKVVNEEVAPIIADAAKHGHTACLYKVPASHVLMKKATFDVWAKQFKKVYGYSITLHEQASNGNKTYIISW